MTKRLLLFPTLILLLSDCSMPTFIKNQMINPEEILDDAIDNMSTLESIRTLGETTFQGKLLGTSYEYTVTSEGQTRIEDHQTVEAYMTTSMKGSGIPDSTDRFYFNQTQYGIYDQTSQQWEITDFHPEDQLLVNLFLSSFDPTNSVNQYYDSKIEKKVDIIGREERNGVSCIGLSVEMNADEMMKEVSPILKTFAGSSGSLASSLTGTMVKNMTMIYWVGEEDQLVYGIDTALPTPIGELTTSTIVYDHNGEFVVPE
ncbi:hypothetical protein [Rossellomorea aquimaris]|uniref:hypothetical protein n=1 Tax=Rossellomorea aquimaris TaxID=189382 RepID=UPI0005CA23B9|nr:hypothetical protein [Rossellomorea aquimaris]